MKKHKEYWKFISQIASLLQCLESRWFHVIVLFILYGDNVHIELMMVLAMLSWIWFLSWYRFYYAGLKTKRMLYWICSCVWSVYPFSSTGWLAGASQGACRHCIVLAALGQTTPRGPRWGYGGGCQTRRQEGWAALCSSGARLEMISRSLAVPSLVMHQCLPQGTSS